MINNHKFFSFFLIGMNIFTAGYLVNFLKNKQLLVKCLGLVTFILLTFSGVIDLFPIINDHVYYLDDSQSMVQNYIEYSTPKDSVFLTTTYFYNPASLSGRKIFIDYGYFAWSLGYEDGKRRQLLNEFFSAEISTSVLCEQLLSNDIDYVLFSPGKGSIDHPLPKESILYTQFQRAVSFEDGYELIDIAQNCFNNRLLFL